MRLSRKRRRFLWPVSGVVCAWRRLVTGYKCPECPAALVTHTNLPF